VPTYDAFTTWVLSKLAARAPPPAPPVSRWVHARWRLVQDPKAPPLHLTPDTSAQLQRAVLASGAELAGVPPERCQALLASSVGVVFGVRSKASLDSGAALGALQAAFSEIAGGFAPFRIAVRVAEPLAALHDAPGGGDGRGGGARRRRRVLARRALRGAAEDGGDDDVPLFPEKQARARAGAAGFEAACGCRHQDHIKPLDEGILVCSRNGTAPRLPHLPPHPQVLSVTFRDLAPSNATQLADRLAARCGGAPSGCLSDIRRALLARGALPGGGDGEDDGLRVSMLARPQSQLSVTLAVGLTEDDPPEEDRAAAERLRQWAQQRDVVEFLEQLTLLAVPYREGGPGRGGAFGAVAKLVAQPGAAGLEAAAGQDAALHVGGGGRGGRSSPALTAAAVVGAAVGGAAAVGAAALLAAAAVRRRQQRAAASAAGAGSGTGSSGSSFTGGGSGRRALKPARVEGPAAAAAGALAPAADGGAGACLTVVTSAPRGSGGGAAAASCSRVSCCCARRGGWLARAGDSGTWARRQPCLASAPLWRRRR
jgi:hypothetical protein